MTLNLARTNSPFVQAISDDILEDPDVRAAAVKIVKDTSQFAIFSANIEGLNGPDREYGAIAIFAALTFLMACNEMGVTPAYALEQVAHMPRLMLSDAACLTPEARLEEAA
jgi:hypothetical protein